VAEEVEPNIEDNTGDNTKNENRVPTTGLEK